MQLVHEMTLTATLDPDTLAAGPGPYGMRAIFTVTGGTVEGERVNGTLRGAGADWILIGADGYGRIDVRTQIVTDDDAVIYLSYVGYLEMNAAVGAAAGSTPRGETGFDDQYFRTTPVFETGDERYAWMNRTVFVARGRITADGVQYEISRVA